MANVKISDLTAATSVGAGDLFEIETAGGASKKSTIELVRANVLTPRGALVKLSADTAATVNYSAGTTVLAFASEVYDTDSVHDNATNNSRLTVPTGVTWVRLSAAIKWQATVTANSGHGAQISKNGTFTYDGMAGVFAGTSYTNPVVNIISAPLAVVAGDYFELAPITPDTASGIEAARTWFCMEILA